VQNKWFIGLCFHQPRQFRLVNGRVNVLVLMVVKKAKEPIQANINARGLNHGLIPRLQSHPAAGHFCSYIAI
jgi:hypothetical protein